MWKAESWVGPQHSDARQPHAVDSLDFFGGEDNLDKAEPNPEPSPVETVSTGYLCFRIYLQKALYVDPKVRKVLRVFEYKEVKEKYPGCTKKQLNTFRDACNIGIFKNASVTVEAVDENNVYALFGKKHNTTIVVSSCAVLDEISNFFVDKTFKVGPQKVLYHVVPGIFKIKQRHEKSVFVA